MAHTTPLYVAIHEAGHAVAMLASECPRSIDYISLIDQPDGQEGFTASHARFQPAFGHLKFDQSNNPELAKAAWLDVVDLFAGSVAESRFKGQSAAVRLLNARKIAYELSSGAITPEPDEDAHKILVRLRWLANPALADGFVKGWADTEKALQPHWKKVEQLGRWLHRDGHISGADLQGWWEGSSR